MSGRLHSPAHRCDTACFYSPQGRERAVTSSVLVFVCLGPPDCGLVPCLLMHPAPTTVVTYSHVLQNKFSSMREVPRPPHFGGFRLRPDRIEFWKGRQTRIHDRIVYVIMDDKWIMQRLQP